MSIGSTLGCYPRRSLRDVALGARFESLHPCQLLAASMTGTACRPLRLRSTKSSYSAFKRLRRLICTPANLSWHAWPAMRISQSIASGSCCPTSQAVKRETAPRTGRRLLYRLTSLLSDLRRQILGSCRPYLGSYRRPYPESCRPSRRRIPCTVPSVPC